MGEVYRARDPRLERDVAIKVLPADVAADPARLRRFEQEARAVAALSHPNVLAIFDVSSGTPPFLVTELLEGGTLRARIAKGRLPVGEAVEIALAVVAGLTAAHGRGIVHRDLKPDNLFVTRDGLVKILDFGLAKAMTPADAEMTQAATLDGAIVGTVGYMSPEQIRGMAVDHRTDIFAVGAVLYEMVSGERAFKGDSVADTMTSVLREATPDISLRVSLPPALARVIHRCLDKNPDGRFQSARDLAFALEPLSTKGPGAQATDTKKPAKSIAVLPFANMSGDAENEFFSDGLAEELINSLARLPDLRVAARTSAFQFRGRNLDIRDIGRQLSVDHVLEGSVRRAGNRLRITAQLISVHDGYHLWSERYDREMADVFDIQDDIASAIVKTIEPTLVGHGVVAAKRHTHNVAAFELYLRGRHLWHMRTPQSMDAAIECFERAIRVDEDYALAYAGMGESYGTMSLYGFVRPVEARLKAEAAAARAMSLDPNLPESHLAMALCKTWLSRHWVEAGRHLEQGLALQPDSSFLLGYYGFYLAQLRRYDEALASATKATTLDSFAPFIHSCACVVAYLAGRHEEAVRHGDRSLELHPDFAMALYLTGFALCQLGHLDRAVERFERLAAVGGRHPIFIGLLGYAYGAAGRRSDAMALADELERRRATEYVIPSAFLLVWAGLDERDRLHAALGECLAEGVNGPAVTLWLSPFLPALNKEPRFAEAFSQLGLRIS
jgi:TolB-like protein/tetratricopeptide (TPR) repeat protein